MESLARSFPSRLGVGFLCWSSAGRMFRCWLGGDNGEVQEWKWRHLEMGNGSVANSSHGDSRPVRGRWVAVGLTVVGLVEDCWSWGCWRNWRSSIASCSHRESKLMRGTSLVEVGSVGVGLTRLRRRGAIMVLKPFGVPVVHIRNSYVHVSPLD